jgi:hypothetical protein
MFDYSPAAIMATLGKAWACADAMYPRAVDDVRDEHAQDAWDNHFHMVMAASFPGWHRGVRKPASLEQSLLALMEEHDLSSISLGMIRNDGCGPFPSVYAHADGFVGSAGRFDLSLAETVAAAIADLKVHRNAATTPVELPALVIGEAA